MTREYELLLVIHGGGCLFAPADVLEAAGYFNIAILKCTEFMDGINHVVRFRFREGCLDEIFMNLQLESLISLGRRFDNGAYKLLCGMKL